MRKTTTLGLLPILFLLVFLAGTNQAKAGKEINRFQFPDVRDDFCGIQINFQYCKCAFHNEYCDQIGLSKQAASVYVWDQYREWVRESINAIGAECVRSGGIWNKANRSCTRCTPPHVNTGRACEEIVEDDFLPEGPFNQDCTTNESFETDWQKYSDIDDRLEEGSRSYEAQQYASIVEQIVSKRAEIYNYKVEMEIDRLARLELRNIRQALVQNIKVNLLKSFWRLSYITYTTIKSGASTGKTYVDMLDPETVVQGVAKGISVIRANVPSDSALAIDTSTAKGKVASIGASGALEAMDSLGDPLKVATKVFDESIKATFPSADITPQEIEILKNQHIRNQSLDNKIMLSYIINSQRRTNVMELEKEVAELEVRAAEWRQKEKNRVRDILEESCRKERDQN